MPQAHCVSNSTSMTYRPLKRPLSVPSPSRKVHNLLPWNEEMCSNHRAVVWHFRLSPFRSNLHDIKVEQPLRETHTAFCPCSCEQFCQRIHRRLPNSTTPSIWANRRKTGFKTNQTAKQHCRKSLQLSVSPLLSQKNTSPHPRTECSSMGGLRRHKCVVCFVQMRMCVSQRQ